jgi:hypothetical protein
VNHEVFAILPGAVGARSGATGLGTVSRLFTAVKECADVRSDFEHDAAAVSSVAAVGPSFRHVLLAPEADTTITAVTGDDVDTCEIDEHGQTIAVARALLAERTALRSPPARTISISRISRS